ncbi:MAG: hypothetical protein IIU87_02770 [Prevotella sp.]|nr:hypothetical protein [Prevotella sp.]
MNKDRMFATDGLMPGEVQESRNRHGGDVLASPRRASVWPLCIDKYSDLAIRTPLVADLFAV